MEAHRRLSMLRVPPSKALVAAVRHVPSRTRPPSDPLVVAAVHRFIGHGMAPQIGPTVEELFERAGQTRYAGALAALLPSIAVGGAAATGVAATAQRFEDESWLILYDVGLEAALWYSAQLLTLVATVGDGAVPSSLDPNVAARAIRLGVAVAALGYDADDLPTFSLDEEQLIVAGELFIEKELFVLAHELGHVLDGRDPLEASSEASYDARAVEELADEIGLELMLGDLAAGQAAEPEAEVRFAAVRVLISVLAAYERGVFAAQPRSHPPATDRWQLLEQRLRTRLGSQLGPLAGAAEAFADEIDMVDVSHPDVERDADAVVDAVASYVVPTVAAERTVLDGVANAYLLLNPPLARLIASAGSRLGNPRSFAIPADVVALAGELRNLRDAGVAVTRRRLTEIADRSSSASALPSWMRSALAASIVAQGITGPD